MIISFLLHFWWFHNQYCQMISYNSCEDFKNTHTYKLRVSIQCFQFNLITNVGQVKININRNPYILELKLNPPAYVVTIAHNNNLVFVYLFVETYIFWGIDIFTIQFYQTGTTLFVETEQNFLATTLENNEGWLDQAKSFKIYSYQILILKLNSQSFNIKISIEVLGSNIDNQFYLCKLFFLFRSMKCQYIECFIAKNEQCDDRNDIPYDGCHFVSFNVLYIVQIVKIEFLFNVQMDINQIKINVIAIVGQLLKMNNVMMEIKFNQMDVIFVNLIVKAIVQIVQIIIIVLNVQMDGIQIMDNVNKYVMIINQLSYQLNNVMIHQINIVLIVKQCSIDNCILCQTIFTCLQCEKPNSLIHVQFVPFCGDRMIYQSTEQCDDGNNIQHDGCYNCQFECLDGCQKCDNQEDQLEEKVSNSCAQNKLLINFECVNQCGNGVIDYEFETCDDGNISGGGGCSFNCQIENFYICKSNDNYMSQCPYTYIPQPKMNQSICQKKFTLNSLNFIQ